MKNRNRCLLLAAALCVSFAAARIPAAPDGAFSPQPAASSQDAAESPPKTAAKTEKPPNPLAGYELRGAVPLRPAASSRNAAESPPEKGAGTEEPSDPLAGYDLREIVEESGIGEYLEEYIPWDESQLDGLLESLVLEMVQEGPVMDDPHARFYLLAWYGFNAMPGKLLMVEHNGKRDYLTYLTLPVEDEICLADVDGDGAVEVVGHCAMNGGYPFGHCVYRLTENGWKALFLRETFLTDPQVLLEEGWRYRLTDPGIGFEASFVMKTTESRAPAVFDGRGSPLTDEPLGFYRHTMGTFFPVDADGDGDFEVFASTLMSNAYELWGDYCLLLDYDPDTDSMKLAVGAVAVGNRVIFDDHEVTPEPPQDYREAVYQAYRERMAGG